MVWSRIRRSVPTLGVAALVIVSLGAFTACSSDDSSTGSTTTTAAPESIIVPDAQVTAGLTALPTIFQSAHDAITSKSATVSSYPDKLEAQWAAIEGTIKKNEPSSYIAFEDALAQMDNAAKNGDAALAQKALDAFNATAEPVPRQAPVKPMSTPRVMERPGAARRLVVVATMALLMVGALVALGASNDRADAATTSTSRSEAISELQVVRTSINETLSLLKEGKREQALAQSRAGYLDHFEYVEIPLRLADPS